MDTTIGARLPLRDPPRSGESINGYIARMAQHNHLERADWVAKTAGIKFPQVSYSDDEIDRLAITTGQDFQTLRPIAPTPGVKTAIGKVSSLLGHDIPTDSLVRVGRRVCPICLIESAEHQIAWTLRFARFCTKHGCRLVNTCPSCGKDLDWRTRAPDVCHCGHELYFQPLKSRLERTEPEEIVGPKYLADMLLGSPQDELPMLTGLRFAEIFFAARRLGAFGASRQNFFWLDDTMDKQVGIWLTRALKLMALDHDRFVRKIISLSPKRYGKPIKKHLSILAEVRTKLTEVGAAEAPLVIALGGIVDQYPEVLA